MSVQDLLDGIAVKNSLADHAEAALAGWAKSVGLTAEEAVGMSNVDALRAPFRAKKGQRRTRQARDDVFLPGNVASTGKQAAAEARETSLSCAIPRVTHYKKGTKIKHCDCWVLRLRLVDEKCYQAYFFPEADAAAFVQQLERTQSITERIDLFEGTEGLNAKREALNKIDGKIRRLCPQDRTSELATRRGCDDGEVPEVYDPHSYTQSKGRWQTIKIQSLSTALTQLRERQGFTPVQDLTSDLIKKAIPYYKKVANESNPLGVGPCGGLYRFDLQKVSR
eukprot:COSAG01_NODE_107_length_25964_cov_174.577576_9_plen_280_part_00